MARENGRTNGTGGKLLSPRSDLIFKKIFGDTDNVDLLRDFLMASLDIPREEYDRLEVVDPHLRRAFPEDKLGILDVLLHTKSGMRIDIEIQVSPMKAMPERLTYYAARLLADQMSAGNPYARVKKVVCIAILDWELIEDSDRYHNRYRLYDAGSGSLFTDVLEIHTMELPKLPESGSGELYYWLKFIGSKRKEEFEMLATKSPEIGKAYAVLKRLSADEQTRLEYEYREKARLDAIARLEYAQDEARNKGLAEGKHNAAVEMSRKMLARGMDPEVIADLSGLSLDEVLALCES